ncbi:MAG: Lar family restriction alleviation protein [Anaerolineales bacterium]|nr:Lar family restriction alleviation protein [Anaerolineales bacterium]
MTELKPCPFCAGLASIEWANDYDCQVQCTECMAQGPRACVETPEATDKDVARAEKEAEDAWNERA